MGNGRSERFDSAPKRGVVKDRENWHNVRPVSHFARPRPAPLLGVLSALALAVGCRTASPPVTRYDPAHDLGPLFQDVQLSGIFADSKTFVDAGPLLAPAEMADRYASARGLAGFSLQRFVEQNFELPRPVGEGFHADPARTMEDHIRALWPVLTRRPDTADARSSLIPLPQPYVVPGGRFREVYYWDSYFTMLGLVASGRTDLVRSMLDNFAYLVETVGHIPNGNRTYYLSRSQPPFFAAMVGLYATATDTTQARPEGSADPGNDGLDPGRSQQSPLSRRADHRRAAPGPRAAGRHGGRGAVRPGGRRASRGAGHGRLRPRCRILLRCALAERRARDRSPHHRGGGPAVLRARHARAGARSGGAAAARFLEAGRVRADPHRVRSAMGRSQRVGAAGVAGDRGGAPLPANRPRHPRARPLARPQPAHLCRDRQDDREVRRGGPASAGRRGRVPHTGRLRVDERGGAGARRAGVQNA